METVLWVWTVAGKVLSRTVVILTGSHFKRQCPSHCKRNSKYSLGDDCWKLALSLSAHPLLLILSDLMPNTDSLSVSPCMYHMPCNLTLTTVPTKVIFIVTWYLPLYNSSAHHIVSLFLSSLLLFGGFYSLNCVFLNSQSVHSVSVPNLSMLGMVKQPL